MPTCQASMVLKKKSLYKAFLADLILITVITLKQTPFYAAAPDSCFSKLTSSFITDDSMDPTYNEAV